MKHLQATKEIRIPIPQRHKDSWNSLRKQAGGQYLSDVSWGTSEDRASHLEWITTDHNGAISWASQKQKSTIQSTMGAEFIAASEHPDRPRIKASTTETPNQLRRRRVYPRSRGDCRDHKKTIQNKSRSLTSPPLPNGRHPLVPSPRSWPLGLNQACILISISSNRHTPSSPGGTSKIKD